MRRDVVQLWKTVSAVVLLGVAVPAWPDMYSAATAYEKGDFTAAFKQFKELAELGKPSAQFNIAVMYARGEGVAANSVLAHAWASIAGQNGEEKGKVLAEKLEPD